MASTGLLVVSNIKQIGKTLRAIEKYVANLYIHLNIPAGKVNPIPTWGRMMSQLYVDSNRHSCGHINLSILVGSLREHGLTSLHLKPVDMIFSDSHFPELCEQLRKHLNIASETIYLQAGQDATNDILEFQSFDEAHKVYDTVVLGGTFDRIHLGHKIFLTQAVLRACRRLVVGVTTERMNKSKTLSELILPVEERMYEVREFLQEIDSNIQYDVVAIDDPFGPTQSDPNMDLIVVSAETLRGGQKVNELRAKNNLRPLEIFCIDLVESKVTGTSPKEAKVSSSNARIDMLGTRIRQPEPRPNLYSEPYVIGLTGNIASGKSKMCDRLAEKGAQVLDCDKIAHEVYEPGQTCYTKLVEHFGYEILDTNKRIDRAKLGKIVFNDAKQLEALNGIVWPELLAEVKRRIADVHKKHNCAVVVIEAAVLLKAGWETECHEVWTTVVPTELAVQRIMERNGLSEEEARKRIATQLDNKDIVAKANVVFSTQWDDAFTRQQLDKAWELLMQDLESKKKIDISKGNNSRL